MQGDIMSVQDPRDKKGDDWIREQIQGKAIAVHLGWPPSNFRKIIDSEAYSSKTMSRIAEYHTEDVEQWYEKTETLYQTRGGSFLLVGYGNILTPWVKFRPDGKDSLPGHGFLPLSENDAKEWMELRGLDDEYAEVFGDGDGDGDEGAEAPGEILLRVSPIFARRIIAAAARENVPVQQWIQSKLAAVLG